jgi:pyruvate dehydrogenase E2 component (dihydrolipoamide acetyltransferase)
VYEFKLPDLGEGIHEGELLKWHVAVDGPVVEDAPLCDVETDKAAVTIPSPRGGRVVALNGAPGSTVKTGQVIAVIDDGAGAAVETRAVPVAAPAIVAPALPTPPPVTAEKKQPVAAAPATRRIARELGVDINLVTATGKGGRVTPDDVKNFAARGKAAPAVAPAPRTPAPPAPVAAPAAAAGAPPPEAGTPFAHGIPFLDIEPLPDFAQWGPVVREPLRSIRRRVAHRMVTSMILVPHVAHMDEADVTLLEEFRKREQQRHQGQPGGHLTLLPFVIKAITAGLRAAPAFNASLDPFSEEIVFKNYFNVGVAVDTGRGLIVPVVKATDRRSIMQISAEIERLAVAARDGKSDVEDLHGGTFTITNIGPLGGTALIPAINYPEVAILGMGKVQEKPVVRDGQIVIRKMLPLTLAFDHRIADGADAARFVSELARQLSDPNLLLLES